MSQHPFRPVPYDSQEGPAAAGYDTGPAADPDSPGSGWYVVALVAGVPVALSMAYIGLDMLLAAAWPLPIISLMGLSATAGSVFAVMGLGQRPRRYRALALWLTIPPAIMFVVGVLLYAVLIHGLVVSHSDG